MEYYYLDRVRWNFGFENPNHAAAFIASLLPFLWALGRTVRFQRPIFRILWGMLAATALIAGWWLLGLTLSRGGLVAAVAGFALISWKTFPDWKTRWLRPLVVAVAIGGVVGFTGLGERASEGIVRSDASIENRLEVWKGGLQMLAIAPTGVGGGKSGEFYMHWIQPTDSTAGYRTLVNGYLTYLTEYGMLLGFGVLCGLGLIFLWLRPTDLIGSRLMWAVASYSSLLSFGIASIFSTTFETPAVWAPPIFALLILVGFAIKQRSWNTRPFWRSMGQAAAASAVLVFGLWGIGKALTETNGLKVKSRANGEIALILPDAEQTWAVLPDETVAGTDYGKRLRELAKSKKINLRVTSSFSNVLPVDGVVVMGKQVERFTGAPIPLVLIAPTISEKLPLTQMLEQSSRVRLINPGFDEDGRVEFWNELISGFKDKGDVMTLEGFGNDLTQGWSEISRFILIGK